ncbi:hypothetical protein JHL17_02505 [Azospirillum sp. YIM B02556]|uniref:Uncharacterized protein n=1 Tax=Azospirillum endophyticum TaxID=2800326 RepID=A0ABS1EYM8_9PROT|nr:hypothetical protein [Azospirillum endophyticum]MBK1836274.1 hypothetical protein [Azospirillum endophyticum]
MQINGYNGYSAGLQGQTQAATARKGWGTAAGPTTDTAAVTDFLAEAKKTPAERIRDDWLARHKMTEDDLNAMPPEKREAMEKEFAEELKRKLTGQDAKRGAVMNLTA